ncbi:MAG: hypothetical protein NXI21_02690 [Alphaproteobacteria bacterium]|nr:hypothetical protein [Alphaproteobacteria bacterium]
MAELLYAGFDTLDVAFQGALPEEIMHQLDEARDRAEAQQEKVLVQIGPNEVQAHIQGHGMRGGYRYLLDTGPLGAKWMIKRNTDAAQWNLFASPRATTLLAYGYKETFRRLLEEIERMGGRVMGHSINRADFAMDVETRGFELHPEQIVAHSHSKVSPYWGKRTEAQDEDQPVTVFRGRRVESITVGKQPGRQIIIYDKRREAIERQKPFWFEVWGKDRENKDLEVWRVEVRAGKSELKHKFRLSTLQDFEASIGDVITDALANIRYLADWQLDSNVSRQELHPLWRAAQETAGRDLTELRSGLTPGQVREVERTLAQERYLGMCAGNAIGLGIADGMSDEEIQKRLPELVAAKLARHFRDKGPALHDTIKRSRERLVFIE